MNRSPLVKIHRPESARTDAEKAVLRGMRLVGMARVNAIHQGPRKADWNARADGHLKELRAIFDEVLETLSMATTPDNPGTVLAGVSPRFAGHRAAAEAESAHTATGTVSLALTMVKRAHEAGAALDMDVLNAAWVHLTRASENAKESLEVLKTMGVG